MAMTAFYRHNEYRELDFGEKIEEGDVFISKGEVFDASDIGNGVYCEDHLPHFRCTNVEDRHA